MNHAGWHPDDGCKAEAPKADKDISIVMWPRIDVDQWCARWVPIDDILYHWKITAQVQNEPPNSALESRIARLEKAMIDLIQMFERYIS